MLLLLSLLTYYLLSSMFQLLSGTILCKTVTGLIESYWGIYLYLTANGFSPGGSGTTIYSMYKTWTQRLCIIEVTRMKGHNIADLSPRI
jgi:hypothetical protein